MTQEKALDQVKMADGRTVEFSSKKKLIKTTKVLDDGALALQIDFRNGETRTYVLNDVLRNQFALHGASQKYGDEVSGVEDIDDMVIALDELHDRLGNGEWGVKREASGISGTSVLLRALMEVTGKTADTLKSWLAAKSAAEKAELRKSSILLPTIQRIEAEKAAGKQKTINEKELFAGLE